MDPESNHRLTEINKHHRLTMLKNSTMKVRTSHTIDGIDGYLT